MVKRVMALVAGVVAASMVWAAPVSAQSGNQTFNIQYNGSSTGTVNASGPISGTGSARHRSDFTDQLLFKTGSVTMTRSATNHVETFGGPGCIHHVRESGRYQLSNGSKQYRGATGTGTYTLRSDTRSTIGSNCNTGGRGRRGRRGRGEKGERRRERQPQTFTGTITAQGTTHLR